MNQSAPRIHHCLFLFLVLTLFQGCAPHHYLPKPVQDPLPSFYVPEKIRVALVLGSGGVRGMAHVGVIEELVANGIPIDLIVGCSAGSIVGAFYAEDPDIERVKKAVWQLRANSILDLDICHCRYGLSQGNSLYHVLDKCLNAEKFEQLKIPLVVVASDLHTGELVVIGGGDLVEAVRASCSIPLVFVPCEYKGRVLVDGGVVNPVPVKVARDLGADVIIAVDLCELLDKTFPTNLLQIASRSAEIAFMWQNQSCSRGSDVVIRPKTCGVGAFNDSMKMQIYEAGKRAAREQIPRIKAIVASLSPDDGTTGGKRLVSPVCYTPQIYLND